MVVIVRNFFDKEHQHVQIALEDCKDLPKVCKEKGLRNACEWIDHSLPVRMYFDIDDKTCSTSLEDWLSSLSRVLHLTCDPISICSSHGTSRNSWHIVYPYKTTLPVCKSLAEKFNRASILKVDASVYKNGQKWRLAGSCKPLSLDAEQRIKIIEKGTFVDTLLGFFNGDEINYKNTDLHLSHPHLIWFQTVLNEPQLEELWRQKSNDYLAWILVGFSIYWECTRDPKSSALELFKIFSAFSPQYKEDETTAKFQGECCKAEKSQFEVIKRWVTTYNKEIADKYSHLYQTKKNNSTTDQAINFIPHAIEDFTITAEAFFQFIPTTVQQFRFYSLLTRSPGLCAYWKKELSDFRNISRLIPLLVIGPSKEMNRQTIVNYAIVQKAKEVYGRNVLLPLHSNQLESCKSFIEFLCQYLEVPINTSLLSDSLLEIPKIIDRYTDKKNEETFENISIWTKYADIVEFYTPDICHLVNRTISEHYIERLGKEEIQVRYLDRIHSWIHDIEKGTILWQDRIPYLSVWYALLTLPIPKDLLHERIEFFILCYLEFCSADKLFGFLARAFSSHSAAEIVFQFYPHWIIDSNELLVYDYLTGRWTNEESVMLRIIAKYASVLECQMDRGKLNYGESYPKRKEVMNEIICLEKLALSARQHKDLVSSSSRCLLFPNGYYDGNEDRFIPVQTFNIGETLKLKGEHVTFFLSPHIMFFGAIPDPYEETEDLQLQELLKQKYFLDVFDPDVADHILEAIMCALMGIDRKDFYINLGETNSGKSGFKTFMEKSFGTFAGTTGLESLAYNPNEKDSVKFRFVCALSRVRMLFTSEGANITLDTEMIKILVSQGLDVVTARLKGGNEKQFQIHFKLFMYMNNPPVFSIQDNALIGRATYYLYRKSFVKPDDYTDPTSQIIMDETIKNWCHLQSHRQAFVRLCLHAYRKLKARSFELLPAPACLREESPLTAKKVDPPLAYFQKVMYKLRFTGNPNHYISENELKDVLDSIQKGSTVVGTGKIRQILRSLRLEGSIKREKLSVEGDETVIWKGIQTRSCVMNTEKSSPILTGKDYDLWRRYMEEQRGCLSDDFLAELENAHMYLRQSKKRKNDGEPSNLDQLGIALMQKFYLI